MTNIYVKYGEYYDLIYKDKNYEQECLDIEEYFRRYSKREIKDLLDIACGTGGHSLIFARKGYNVVGIDLSPIMIEKAKRKAMEMGLNNVKFLVQDMRKLNLNIKFDATICLFGSFGYLTSDNEVLSTLRNIRMHLNDDALFIFDFWPPYSIALSPIRTSIRKIVSDDITILRLIKTDFSVINNVCKFEIECYVIKNDKLIDHFTEDHVLRTFTINELKHFLFESNFKPIEFFNVNWGGDKIYTFDMVNEKSTNAVCIAIAI